MKIIFKKKSYDGELAKCFMYKIFKSGDRVPLSLVTSWSWLISFSFSLSSPLSLFLVSSQSVADFVKLAWDESITIMNKPEEMSKIEHSLRNVNFLQIRLECE